MQSNAQDLSSRMMGGILLIAGSCIGAGMLGLPVISALAGFTPTLFLFFLSWIFMVATGLLLLEVNLWFQDEVSLISLAERTIGSIGKVVGWVGFLFVFYALMVAFISGTGDLLADFYHHFTGETIPSWMGSFVACGFFGLMVYLGTQAVDWLNRLFMLGLVVAYAGLVYFGLPHVNTDYLKHTDWSASYLAIPAMIISFGYHNLIPTLKTYLKGDVKSLKKTVFFGSGIPLVVYILWELLILGLVPLEGEGGFRQAYFQGDMATQVLRNAVGSGNIVDLAQYFAFFAIVTSFLGVALSFVDFLADGLHIKKDAKGKALLCLAVIALPLVFSLIYPKLFLIALRYAGGFGALVLFALLPAAMVWSGRYRLNKKEPQLLPGGKISLLAIVVTALAIMGLQLFNDLNS
jgi:tyrosine-specific transport protein